MEKCGETMPTDNPFVNSCGQVISKSFLNNFEHETESPMRKFRRVDISHAAKTTEHSASVTVRDSSSVD